MDTHYVCNGGCNGVSPTPGTCGADTCAKHDLPLIECKCTDGSHEGIVNACTNCGTLCKVDGGKGCALEVQKPELT